MTDQEFDRELAERMEESPSEKKKRRIPLLGRIGRLSRKKKILTGAVAAAAALVFLSGVLRGKEEGVAVEAAFLEKGDIQETLSVSGPVSGTDSAEVVSRLHAEILELLVKEGDKVKAGQVLARLDPADLQKEVEIAENDYDLAVAQKEEARRQAESGYDKALQEQEAAGRDYERKSMLFGSGDISQVEMEAAEDALRDARRQVASYTLVDGQPVAGDSYDLRVKSAEFALEKKKKELEETEVVSPIDGTVVRVNSRVGRLADQVDNDQPLFVIDNLDQLEMKISVSEYSIGKVKVGQEAMIEADILNGEAESGVITAISPTGEEKGGGSTERVIPTTITIQNRKSRLIAGITARAKIVLNEARDAWVVPIGAVLEREDGNYLAVLEKKDGTYLMSDDIANGNGRKELSCVLRLLPVEIGVESDVSMEVRSVGEIQGGTVIPGEALAEGLAYVPAPDESLTDGMTVTVRPLSQEVR